MALDPGELDAEGGGQGPGQHGLAHAGDVLDQEVVARHGGHHGDGHRPRGPEQDLREGVVEGAGGGHRLVDDRRGASTGADPSVGAIGSAPTASMPVLMRSPASPALDRPVGVTAERGCLPTLGVARVFLQCTGPRRPRAPAPAPGGPSPTGDVARPGLRSQGPRARGWCRRTGPGPPATGPAGSVRSSSVRRGSTTRRGVQAAATSSSSAQVPTAMPARIGGAEGGGLEHRGDLDGPAAGVGQGLDEDRVGRHAPVDPERARWAGPSPPPPPRGGRRPGGPPPPGPPAPARVARCPGSGRRRCPGRRSPTPGCPVRGAPARTRRRRCRRSGRPPRPSGRRCR